MLLLQLLMLASRTSSFSKDLDAIETTFRGENHAARGSGCQKVKMPNQVRGPTQLGRCCSRTDGKTTRVVVVVCGSGWMIITHGCIERLVHFVSRQEAFEFRHCCVSGAKRFGQRVRRSIGINVSLPRSLRGTLVSKIPHLWCTVSHRYAAFHCPVAVQAALDFVESKGVKVSRNRLVLVLMSTVSLVGQNP